MAREEKARVELEAKKKQAELEARYAMIEKDFAEKLKKAKTQADDRSDSEGAHADATGRAGGQGSAPARHAERPTTCRSDRSSPSSRSATFRTIRTLGL